MSNETGATDSQIEAAKQRHPLMKVLRGSPDYEAEMDIRVNDWAPLLVPPDHRIVFTGKTSALRYVVDWMELCDADGKLGATLSESTKFLRALIGGE